jgi:hypothetical protein
MHYKFLSQSLSIMMILILIVLLPACDESSESSTNENNDSPSMTISNEDMGMSNMAGMSGIDNTAPDMNQPTVDMEVSVDMMGESNTFPVFEGELVTCTQNETFESLRPILSGGRANPTGRGEHAAAYDPCNQRIILFGGNDFQPEECADFGPKRFKGDTWMYSLEYDNWVRLELGDAPDARGRHHMILDQSRKKIYLYGGRYRPEDTSGSYRIFSDMWSFDLNTDTWTKMETTGDKPGRKFNAAMIYDHLNDQVIFFGGNSSSDALNLAPENSTYILDLNTMVWREVNTQTKPPKSIYHSMSMHSSANKLVLFGGGDANAFLGPFYTDVWAFDLATETWEKVWTPAMGTSPDARINASMIDDVDNERIILFAGHDDTRIGHRNDVWSFTIGQGWSPVIDGDAGAGEGCNSFCSCPPNFVEVDMNSPERRQYQSLIPILGENRAILFGGKSDCGYLDDTWSFGFNDDQWTEIEPAGQGEACMRTGQEGCTDLCY